MNIKCYVRYKKDSNELLCLCKRNNPACDRHRTCIKEIVNLNEYKGIGECFNNSEKRR